MEPVEQSGVLDIIIYPFIELFISMTRHICALLWIQFPTICHGSFSLSYLNEMLPISSREILETGIYTFMIYYHTDISCVILPCLNNQIGKPWHAFMFKKDFPNSDRM